MTYSAPVDDIFVALKSAAGLDAQITNGNDPGYPSGVNSGLDSETIRAILEEAGSFAAGVLDPLNSSGDRCGSKLVNGSVVTPPGFKEAYQKFSAAGWSALPCPEEYGGQGLPEIVSAAVCEIWNSANMAFGMCPLLTQGAIHALNSGGSAELKQAYLPKMISGHWTGTMNLTEPHAGSDLSELKTRAVRQGDGTYLITGTKIFISFGDHDMAENIIHLVLARLPDAPPGTRGISLFLAPKICLNDDGSLGARNDVICAGVEHKLGITASPTCVMKFGEGGGATGYLVGEENRGLATMFVMMNQARLAVGMQGVAIAERATQRALAFAKERTQGRASGASGAAMSPIIAHPDVRRMLLTMKSSTQAARMICFATAAALDAAHQSTDAQKTNASRNLAALLTPVAKAFATDTAVEVASLGVQVHGGMGYVEETGAAQHLRDARILPIYEGTNGIQAVDLIMRKVSMDGGKVISGYLSEVNATLTALEASNTASLGQTVRHLKEALTALHSATDFILTAVRDTPDLALAGATPYLRIFALVAGAHYLARGAVRNDARADDVTMARFFAENCLTAAPGLAETVISGGTSVLSAEGILS